MSNDTVRLRAKNYPENVQEFDRNTAAVLVQRGLWEEVSGETENKPSGRRTASK